MRHRPAGNTDETTTGGERSRRVMVLYGLHDTLVGGTRTAGTAIARLGGTVHWTLARIETHLRSGIGVRGGRFRSILRRLRRRDGLSPSSGRRLTGSSLIRSAFVHGVVFGLLGILLLAIGFQSLFVLL